MGMSQSGTAAAAKESNTGVDTSQSTYGCCIEYDMDCRHRIEKPRRYKNTSSTEMQIVKTESASLVVISSSSDPTSSSSDPTGAGKQT